MKAGLGVAIEGVEDQVTIDVIPGYTPADDIIEFAKEMKLSLYRDGLTWSWCDSWCYRLGQLCGAARIYHSDSCYKVDRKTRIV